MTYHDVCNDIFEELKVVDNLLCNKIEFGVYVVDGEKCSGFKKKDGDDFYFQYRYELTGQLKDVVGKNEKLEKDLVILMTLLEEYQRDATSDLSLEERFIKALRKFELLYYQGKFTEVSKFEREEILPVLYDLYEFRNELRFIVIMKEILIRLLSCLGTSVVRDILGRYGINIDWLFKILSLI